MMPKMSGYDVCRIIRKKYTLYQLPVLMLTAKSQKIDILAGFEAGANDYLIKPIDRQELSARVKTFITLIHSINEVFKLNDEIEDTQREVIITLGEVAEVRSKETGNHVRRVAEYSYVLAKLCGFGPEEAELFKIASPMHDIGKLGVPDEILNKPIKLTLDEFNIIKTHSVIGYEILNKSPRKIMKIAAIIALEHHEKYDGTGYPNGLKGKEISLYGRITALADVFDSLASERVYKKAWELDNILAMVKEQSGKHFDPVIVEQFIQNIDMFIEIRNKYKDIIN
jgi:putative two-component system response regulator